MDSDGISVVYIISLPLIPLLLVKGPDFDPGCNYYF